MGEEKLLEILERLVKRDHLQKVVLEALSNEGEEIQGKYLNEGNWDLQGVTNVTNLYI